MSLEFGPVPLPTSPIEEYFKQYLAAAEDTKGLIVKGTSDSMAELGTQVDEKLDTLSERSGEDTGILESQPESSGVVEAPLEYRVPLAKKLTYLGLYFVLNLGLTLSNKALLQQVRAPWLLTVMHTTGTFVGCSILFATGRLKLSKLNGTESLMLVAFSSLFTLNIAVSNVSLALVSVPFHQVVRSTCPVVTVLIYRTVFNRSYQSQTYLTMIPLVLGVGLATMGDYHVTLLGFASTALGVFLASIKTVTTNRLLTGPLALSATEILLRMSPLAALQCLFYAGVGGELAIVKTKASAGVITLPFALCLVCNAAIAFLLNSVSFQANNLSGALTMSICGNLKQCLTILLGILLFSVEVRPINALGMAVAVGGAAWYSRVELQTRGTR